MQGAMDKAAIVLAHAQWNAFTNRDFLNKLRTIVKNDKSVEDQISTWFKYCCSRTYSREAGDIFANPEDTFDNGGDCDDSTILLLSGLLALGVPATTDVVTRNGNGVHIRVRYGLPPHNPPQNIENWNVLDSSKDSEQVWIGSKGSLYSPKTTSAAHGLGTDVETDTLEEKGEVRMTAIIALAAIAIAGLYFRERYGAPANTGSATGNKK